jgi:hypothetical protein
VLFHVAHFLKDRRCFDISHNADDGKPWFRRIIAPAQLNGTTDWIGVREVPVCKGHIDDGYFLGISSIPRIECSSLGERNAHDVEEVRSYALTCSTAGTLDVNRVARQYLDSSNAVVGTLIPSPTQRPTSDQRPTYEKKIGGFEKTTSLPVRPVQLPSWVAGALEQLKLPVAHAAASDVILKNGLRLIVQTDSTSPTVLVRGSVKHTVEPQSGVDDGAVSDILEGRYENGTQSMDRLVFDKALDDIGADETAGYRFSLNVLKDNFFRGVQLLADNELYPAFRAGDFRMVKRQTSRFVGNAEESRLSDIRGTHSGIC